MQKQFSQRFHHSEWPESKTGVDRRSSGETRRVGDAVLRSLTVDVRQCSAQKELDRSGESDRCSGCAEFATCETVWFKPSAGRLIVQNHQMHLPRTVYAGGKLQLDVARLARTGDEDDVRGQFAGIGPELRKEVEQIG